MLWFKCKSCGFVISEEEIADLAKQALHGETDFGSIEYKACMKCEARNIASAESASDMLPPPAI